MHGFEKLDLVRFHSRTRVSDGALVTSYKPWQNYAATLSEKPAPSQALAIMKRTYWRAKRKPRLSEPNARWDNFDEIRQTEKGWELRYGFGTAEYILNYSLQG